MFTLVQMGLDFEVIEAELEQQTDLLGQELFVPHATESRTDGCAGIGRNSTRAFAGDREPPSKTGRIHRQSPTDGPQSL